MKRFAIIAAAVLVTAVGNAQTADVLRQRGEGTWRLTKADIQNVGNISAAFSPNGGAELLVTKVIDSAKKSIRVMAYSFTSASITSRLLQARKRGVEVELVVDERNNLNEDRSGKSRAALSALANAGCKIRTVRSFAIHHDKVLIIDDRTVETGSYNFTEAAAKRNSENVLVLWDNPSLAKIYAEHFASNWNRGREFGTGY